MNITKDTVFRLTEVPSGLIIGPAEFIVPSGTPLIIADSARLMEYLSRYLYDRTRGATLKDAHEAGMSYAGLTATLKAEKRIG